LSDWSLTRELVYRRRIMTAAVFYGVLKMKRAAVLVSALAVVLYTVGISAQAKPNFAGTWVMDMPAPAAAPAAPPAGGGGGGGGRGGGGRGGGAVSGMEVTIVQDATTLTINKMAGGAGGAAPTPVKVVLTLDGKDSKNTSTGRNGEVVTTSQAVWDGAKLTVTSTADQGRGPTTTKQTISMEGANLVVENFGADGTSVSKLTYKKK
jgi:hypothetical protein